MLVKSNCPICSSNSFREIGKPYEKSQIFFSILDELDEVIIVRCNSCTFVYLYPEIHFSDEHLSRMYNVNYWDDSVKDKDFKNMKDKVLIVRKAVQLYGANVQGKKLLDIGCGMGEFLKIAHDFGMEPLGMDIDKTTTDYILKTYGYNTKTAYLEDGTFEENTFDFIILSHVIEHLENPIQFVRRIHKILKPNGVFIMATPNIDSFFNKAYNRIKQFKSKTNKSFYLMPFISPYHINGFNVRTSRILMKNSNFEILYNRSQSTLSWDENRSAFSVKMLKTIGMLCNSGEQLLTISRKCT